MELGLQEYLYRNIPLSRAMGIAVRRATVEEVLLAAPLSSNFNHQRTAFGGSLHAVATLACWCWLYVALSEEERRRYQIVITHSEVDYLVAVRGDFEACCRGPAAGQWQRFMGALRAKGRGRLSLTATVDGGGGPAVVFSGVFAALPAPVGEPLEP